MSQDVIPKPDETRESVLQRLCARTPGLYAFIHMGIRQQVVRDRDFPHTSHFACRVLADYDGALNDERSGSYRMHWLQVRRIAAKYGLRVVNVQGTLYWSDDVFLPDPEPVKKTEQRESVS